MIIEGDSLVNVKKLSTKFFICKSLYEKYYGFLFHVVREDKNLRRLKWEEPTEMSGERNWILLNNENYVGTAFYSGFIDAKIGDTVVLKVVNKKTDKKIGFIKVPIR